MATLQVANQSQEQAEAEHVKCKGPGLSYPSRRQCPESLLFIDVTVQQFWVFFPNESLQYSCLY